MSKNSLRILYKKKRQELLLTYRESVAQKIADNFIKLLISFKGINNIAGYIAINDELNISSLLNDLQNNGYHILVPCCVKDEMFFHVSYNKSHAEESLELVPDLIIVPLIAVDYMGNRIGYGRGFYDKKISLLLQQGFLPLLVGVCYEIQLSNYLPHEEHDQKMHYIVTEKQIISVNGE